LTLAPDSGFQPIRIACGRAASFVDQEGNTWAADYGHDGGDLYSDNTSVTRTEVPQLFMQVHRSAHPLTYRFAVPNGSYRVNLDFAETTYLVSGQRKFHVDINSNRVLTDFDPYYAGGGKAVAVVQSFGINVTDGSIAIKFRPTADLVYIQTIEILADPQPDAIKVFPYETQLEAAEPHQFSANAVGIEGRVEWSVNGNGAIDAATGLYVAPQVIAADSTVTIKATSMSDPALYGTATVKLKATNGHVFRPIRIVAGNKYGPTLNPVVDSLGNAWTGDSHYSFGSVFGYSFYQIANTKDSLLYDNCHMAHMPFTYSWLVPNGIYTVNLKFADIWGSNALKKKMHVDINENRVLADFDVHAEARDSFTALDKRFNTVVTDNRLNITFTPINADGYSAAWINAIEVLGTVRAGAVSITPSGAAVRPWEVVRVKSEVIGSREGVIWTIESREGTISSDGVYTPPPSISADAEVVVRATSVEHPDQYQETRVALIKSEIGDMPPIRVDAGNTASYTDSQGNVWSADRDYRGGQSSALWLKPMGTADPLLYQLFRWSYDPFRYEFAVPNGTYRVTLKFDEGEDLGPGGRVFNVSINDTAMLRNFDVYVAAEGSNKAVDKTFTVTVNNHALKIAFTPVQRSITIGAIEIVRQ